MRSRAGGDSGVKRSRSSGVVNGREAPSTKKATDEGRHSIVPATPSSSHSPTM